MANSKYWKNLRNNEKTKMKTIEKNISDLETIHTNLSSKLEDEISAVNNKINDLKDELLTAVRHNSSFNNNTNQLDYAKEKTAVTDSLLSQAAKGISDEISSLKTQKQTCETKYNEYDRKYQEAKKDEDWLTQIFG